MSSKILIDIDTNDKVCFGCHLRRVCYEDDGKTVKNHICLVFNDDMLCNAELKPDMYGQSLRCKPCLKAEQNTPPR